MYKNKVLAIACAAALSGMVDFPAATPAAYAQSAQVFDINVPAQPLASALAALSKQTGTQILAAGDLVAGKTGAAVSGRLTAREALSRLLAGSGLEARAGASGGFTVQRAAPAAPAAQGEQQLTEVKVQAGRDPNQLSAPYAGGQVARGGQLGILGNRDVMDTPFNQSNYTSELIQNQNVQHVADILDNDPTARATASASTAADEFMIRGFAVSNTDLLFNGMPSVTPSFFNSIMTESLERVEVLKGPNALLNGFASFGSIGGMINLVPKRAGNAPLTQFNASLGGSSQLGGHLDLGRRFGPDGAVGVRLNAVYRDGDTAIDHQSRTSKLLTLGADFQSERVRLSVDAGYQDQNFTGTRDFPTVAFGVQVPGAPDSKSNYQGTSGFSHPKVFYGAVRGEFDLAPAWTLFGGVGGNERKTQYLFTGRTINNANGDLDAFAGNAAAGDKMNALALDAGVRGRLKTGPVSHELVVAYNQLDREWRRTRVPYAAPASNIYNPTFGPDVDRSTLPDPDSLGDFQLFESSSVAIADTLSILEGHAQLTLGARYQKLYSNFVPFAFSYGDDAVTPSAAVLIKPWKGVSLYANYIEGLEEGATAPLGTVNAGQGFPPFVAKQKEVGAKWDLGRFTTTLAYYQITRQSSYTDTATNTFRADGEQRHNGIDFNVFGEVARGVRLLGGVAWIDSKMVKTQGGMFDGRRGVGVPESRVALGAEWDTPFAPGLTLTGRVVANSSVYLDPGNTQSVPSWTRLDLGMRYRVNKMMVMRATLTNALDKGYWDGNTFGQLTLSDPRTLTVSASFDF